MGLKVTSRKIKVCYVLSYKSPDYIRTRVLTTALSKLPAVELSTAINSTRSLWRYGQTLCRLLIVRLTKHPKIYILGFRGQEIYWPVRLLTIGRPLIFDEFINMHDWLGQENNKLPKWLIKLADWYERSVLKTCQYILTDTKLGAASSSRTYDIPLSKYRPIYVGADESLFYPRTGSKKNSQLEVFFYGTLAPLHGVEHILDAARRLVGEPIHLTIIGGKGKPSESKSVTSYIKLNSLENVTYKEWVDFEKLPDMMAAADVFLGGPFGDTSQAKRVITGKTFQSLAVGKATVVGKINEAAGFKDKVNCLLVEQGSGQALQAALLWASRNRSKLPDLGKAGHQLYGQTFSSQSVADELKIILDSL